MGIVFGIVLIFSEVVSWFRIQEMFRFQSFHMYGIIGSAVAVAAVSIQVLKRTNARTIRGETITISDKPWNKGTNQLLGGIVFGLGWGLLGACPGPIYALIGAGITPLIVGLFAALLGALTYGHLKPKLPH
ncbi:transporter [Longibacter salinarum]|uniref:Transporter n=2 Tax=Longibacter salinarum TaxID=1850348 RepID=A0A2A8D3S2_9BACT|nr:transporter [Longibacter salinarum]